MVRFQGEIMSRLILVIGCILLLISAYINSKETETLESKVSQLEILLGQYKERNEKCMELARKGAKISELCFAITEKLDELDGTIYGGKYLGNVRQDKAKPEDIANGYLKLIDQASKDLERK
jgi:hypothetical protein